MGRAEDNKRDKRERIMAAGRHLFSRHGYAGTTMDDVARHAGVSKGALYFHTGSKAGLVNQLFEADFTAWIEQAFTEPDDRSDRGLLDRLVAVYARLLQLMCDAPDLTRVFMAEAGAGAEVDEVRSAMHNLLGRTVDLLEWAKHEGELVPEVNSRRLAYNLWALYFVEQHRWLLQPPGSAPPDPITTIEARLRPRFTTQLDGYLVGR
ncbi:MAG: TetR/AcrR family transcriptional regulator [Acidimicrobiales bacterium]